MHDIIEKENLKREIGKKEWSSPELTRLRVSGTKSGPISEPSEDPLYTHYGPKS